MHDFDDEDDEHDDFEKGGRRSSKSEAWHATQFLNDLLGRKPARKADRTQRSNVAERSQPSTVGRIASGVSRVSSGIRNVSSTIGRVSSGIGQVSSGLSGISSALGGVSSSLGGLSSTIGDASSRFSGVASGIGRVSSTLGSASSALGSVSAEAGRVSSSLGGVSAAVGRVSSSVSNLSTSIGRGSAGAAGLDSSLGNPVSSVGVTTSARGLTPSMALNLNTAVSATGRTSASIGKAFDRVVRFGESTDEAWDAVALPNSVTPEARLKRGDLVLQRAQGAAPLGRARVFGEDVGPAALYASNGRIRSDILILRGRKRSAGESALGENVPQRGRGSFRLPFLAGSAGDNVEARWNVDATTRSGTTIDIVVHLHGYGEPRPDFIAHKAERAGVELVDPSGRVIVRASRPTLVLVPRARRVSGTTTWLFNLLSTQAQFDALITAGLGWLASSVLVLPSGSALQRGRLTIMAHSGGGAGLNDLLQSGVDPDEVVCFDATYGSHTPISSWVRARLRSTHAATSALRVFYRACGPSSWRFDATTQRWKLTSTELNARRLQRTLDVALANHRAAASLANRFRVQRTSIGHNDIPEVISPVLLEDISAEVPRLNGNARAFPPPPHTTRPACVANDDWLDRAARRPGGEEPP